MGAGFGAFGKMPTVGDFFRLDPPGGFVPVWDRWVQEVLLAGQQTYGPYWDGHYMSAPIWRFTLAPGLAGPGKVLGVMMPSVDRVGRRFPLTLAAPLATPGPAAQDHLSETALFEQLEEIALDALEDTMTRERLAQELSRLAVPGMRAHAPLRGGNDLLVLTGVENQAAVPRSLAADLLAQHPAGVSIWSTVVQDVPRLLAARGLPAGPQAVALFDLAAPVWTETAPL
jgi:type VI secretion system protein ImpM